MNELKEFARKVFDLTPVGVTITICKTINELHNLTKIVVKEYVETTIEEIED